MEEVVRLDANDSTPQPRYCAIPQDLLLAAMDAHLPGGQLAVLLWIAYRAYKYHGDGAKAQAIYLAEFEQRLHLDRSSVIRAIRALKAAGVIEVESRRRGPQRNAATLYSIKSTWWRMRMRWLSPS